MKNKGARLVPQFTPSMQSSDVFIRSFIILGQSSPVDILNRMTSAYEKFEKFM
jgi:hypothetical protein